MDVYLFGHEHRYAVEQMLLTLWPEERPVYPAALRKGEGLHVSLRRGGRYVTAACRLDHGGRRGTGQARRALSRLGTEEDAARLEQRLIKLSIYRAALAAGHSRPVWGCLTGVRPAKFFDGLVRRDALSPAAAERTLREECGVAPERAALCRRTWEAAERARGVLAPGDVCLYVSIPYCPSRCAYCSFVSVEAPRQLNAIPAYLDALEAEAAALSAVLRESGRRIVSVYVGGGTPTTLSAPELERLLGMLRGRFDLSACRELTVEAGRPDTLTEEKLLALKRLGADRVSVNPQTMSDAVLSAIGRRHSAAEVRAAAAMAKEAGLCLNMDLIAGLPGDTPEGFAATVAEVLSLRPENVTVHTLALKKGSGFLTGERTALPSGEAVGRMLLSAREALTAAGFRPYYMYRQKFMSGGFENVGWTRPGRENLYNICIMEELCSVLALGAGGSTKLVAPGGVVRRLMAPKYPREYMERLEELLAQKPRITQFFQEHPVEQKGEYAPWPII